MHWTDFFRFFTKKGTFFLLLMVWVANLSVAQLTLVVTNVPDNTPTGASIFIAGNFNNWSPDNADFRLSPNGDTHQITIQPPIGTVEYKFTRGGWDTVEGNAGGGFLPNRTFEYDGTPTETTVSILSWEDLGGDNAGNGTATENVHIISETFYMPQLARTRRIWIYLPPDYADSDRRYPVLYMHDGQNLFDVATSFSGEWEIDESLNRLFEGGDAGAIVVGIDNGGASRLDEYSPWENPAYGGGEGEAYIQFLVQTLKPYIDTNYRTRPERDYTGIVGSSMGGLISMYAGIEHQDVFSKVGALSSAFWFSPDSYTHVLETGKEADMRFYLLAGQLEGNGSVAEDAQQMYQTLLQTGFGASEINLDIDADGQHSEWYWRREFPDVYQWLCASETTAATNTFSAPQISVFPNPTTDILRVVTQGVPPHTQLYLHSLSGQVLLKTPIVSGYNYIDTSHLPDSMYVLEIREKGVVIFTQKVVVR